MLVEAAMLNETDYNDQSEPQVELVSCTTEPRSGVSLTLDTEGNSKGKPDRRKQQEKTGREKHLLGAPLAIITLCSSDVVHHMYSAHPCNEYFS